MSLYYDAAPLLVSKDSGSLKSQVFGAKDLKSPPNQVFALVTEASKWSEILAEVIEKSGLLQHERKLSPSLALLLVHDLLLCKKGISAPASHPLRLAVTRHKARLNAEFTKARLRRGVSSVETFRTQLDDSRLAAEGFNNTESRSANTETLPVHHWAHPRWIRINTIKTNLGEQIQTTFAGYTPANSIEELLNGSNSIKVIYVDKNVPDLVAVLPSSELANTDAYRKGQIIFQDKASCFPAYLLGPPAKGRNCLDACAAPGNKTTHLAAILQGINSSARSGAKIFACERDKARAATLQKMVSLAGAEDVVTVRPTQDFLRLDPNQPPWDNVGSILLDPSCSGSGIVGRDDAPNVTLPSGKDLQTPKSRSRKRKRCAKDVPVTVKLTKEATYFKKTEKSPGSLNERLEALSAFQLKILLHAFRFPNASSIVYSTCSVHAQENEHVVMKALQSSEAIERGWRIMQPEEQTSGLRSWAIRGDYSACLEIFSNSITTENTRFAGEIADACIRCVKGTKEGTQGFFVAGFVRPEKGPVAFGHASKPTDKGKNQFDQPESLDLESDWEGFDTSDSG